MEMPHGFFEEKKSRITAIITALKEIDFDEVIPNFKSKQLMKSIECASPLAQEFQTLNTELLILLMEEDADLDKKLVIHMQHADLYTEHGKLGLWNDIAAQNGFNHGDIQELNKAKARVLNDINWTSYNQIWYESTGIYKFLQAKDLHRAEKAKKASDEEEQERNKAEETVDMIVEEPEIQQQRQEMQEPEPDQNQEKHQQEGSPHDQHDFGPPPPIPRHIVIPRRVPRDPSTWQPLPDNNMFLHCYKCWKNIGHVEKAWFGCPRCLKGFCNKCPLRSRCAEGRCTEIPLNDSHCFCGEKAYYLCCEGVRYCSKICKKKNHKLHKLHCPNYMKMNSNSSGGSTSGIDSN